MHEDKTYPQLAHDITECFKKVINLACNTREISDYGNNKGSSSVNCRHSGKMGKKKTTTNIRLPRINQSKIEITPPFCETGTLN